MWQNTTHDWAATVDHAHLAHVRAAPARYAPDGTLHLVLEALAYPAEEALETGGGQATVTLHTDGSISVSDNGRGTATLRRPDGTPVRKPVMATEDLRFFDADDAPRLPDGHPRRGMSVVAALSRWLVHTNHRRDGSWTQRYEHGIPVTDLIPIDEDSDPGTTVHFMPDIELLGPTDVAVAELDGITWPSPFAVRVRDTTHH